MLALYSCNNEAPVDVPKGDKTTQYVESLLANASKNLDLDALVEEFVSKLKCTPKRRSLIFR